MAIIQSKLHFLSGCVGLNKSNVTQFSDPVLFFASRTNSCVLLSFQICGFECVCVSS